MGKYNFDKFKDDSLTKPRDLAWENWAKFEKVGAKVQGFIRDAFYRKAEMNDDGTEMFGAQRGLTLEQEDGTLINVGVKRFDFILNKTDDLHIGDPLTIVFEKQNKPQKKGFSGVKVYAFYGTQLPENEKEPTVRELDQHDEAAGGTESPTEDAEEDDGLDLPEQD